MRRSAAIAATIAISLVAASAAWATGPFTIWFEAGSVRLTAQDETTLDYAAAWLRQTLPLAEGRSHILLEASADRSGSAAANLRLSRRRGEVVKAALIRRGFPAASIAIAAFGESRQIVDTADGVPERQNRFVMIFAERGPSTPDGASGEPRR